MKITCILDVFYYNGELWNFQMSSTESNVASEMILIRNFFKLLTHISWILVLKNLIWNCFQKSFFWFGESITFLTLLRLRQTNWPWHFVLEGKCAITQKGSIIMFCYPFWVVAHSPNDGNMTFDSFRLYFVLFCYSN